MWGIKELIDTLWNVNVSFTLSTFKSFIELIDTLWNVNKSVSDGDKVYVGINRYIMECKFITQKSIRPVLRELIDTLWNVNTPIYIATN